VAAEKLVLAGIRSGSEYNFEISIHKMVKDSVSLNSLGKRLYRK
jgi:hypothetical protein